jgi:hypothetical protein
MDVIGPERYKLTFDAESFTVLCPRGSAKFSGLATAKLPKLYIASVENKPIYVGVTKQPIRNRLRLGWNAKGASGYYGYAWRHKFTEAHIDIWYHRDATPENSCLDIETVEAEVVFLIRCVGQWPLFQTEIHFHPSSTEHRRVAAQIAKTYGITPEQMVPADGPAVVKAIRIKDRQHAGT